MLGPGKETMNTQELHNLTLEIAGHIAEILGWEADADAHEEIAGFIARGVRPLIPDSFERDYLNRLIQAARQVANRGAIDHDSYVCGAAQGKALRAAVSAYDSLMEQRDREEQEEGEEEPHEN